MQGENPAFFLWFKMSGKNLSLNIDTNDLSEFKFLTKF